MSFRAVRPVRTLLSCVLLVGAVALLGCKTKTDEARAGGGGATGRGYTADVTLFAGAGMTDVMTRLAKRFEAESGLRVGLNFAASSTLARQIEQGARADVFVSANHRWMDFLEERDLIDATTREDLLSNGIVLVAPRGEAFSIELSGEASLARAFEGRLSLGDPDHVPAGIYARQALEHYGWWEPMSARLLPAPDVRRALAVVELGEAPAGIVYATDAVGSDRVETVARFPETSHEPIRFPVAACRGARPTAQRFVTFLKSDAASAIFRRAGFVPLAADDRPPAPDGAAPEITPKTVGH